MDSDCLLVEDLKRFGVPIVSSSVHNVLVVTNSNAEDTNPHVAA